MRIFALIVAASVALSPVNVSAQAFPTSDMRAELESESSEMMISALERARQAIENPLEGPVINLPYICPHAMRALSAVAAGTVDRELGTRMFFAGLVQDQADFITTKIRNEPGLNLERGNVVIQVRAGKDLDQKQLLSLIDAGVAFMK